MCKRTCGPHPHPGTSLSCIHFFQGGDPFVYAQRQGTGKVVGRAAPESVVRMEPSAPRRQEALTCRVQLWFSRSRSLPGSLWLWGFLKSILGQVPLRPLSVTPPCHLSPLWSSPGTDPQPRGRDRNSNIAELRTWTQDHMCWRWPPETPWDAVWPLVSTWCHAVTSGVHWRGPERRGQGQDGGPSKEASGGYTRAVWSPSQIGASLSRGGRQLHVCPSQP